MSTTGTNNRAEYLTAWSKMMVNIWLEKIVAYRAYETGALFQSVRALPPVRSERDIEVLEHTFNFYGIYVDKGVGKEISRGNGGDLGFTPNRKAKPWFNKKYYYYVFKLAEKLAEIEGLEFTYAMRDIIENKK